MSLAGPLLSGLYADAEVAAHLTAEAEIAAFIRFEAALARAEAACGVIPAEAGAALTGALAEVTIEPAELIGPSAAAGLPAPEIVRLLRARVGEPWGQYIHWGATSQDALDTGLVLRLRAVLDLLDARLAGLVATLMEAAETHAGRAMAGRTRTQIATPTTLGLRIAGWAAPLKRCRDRLAELRPRLAVVQLGGASGTLSVLGDRGVTVMAALADDLGLGCPAKPWHAERDSVVELANWLAMVAGLVGRIGADLVLMGRSEIAEVRAGTGGGSSTMPHKANPIAAETLVTLARWAGAQAGLAQQALIHTEDRDGAVWALEWTVLPGLLEAVGAGLTHAAALAGTLEVSPERMEATMALGGGAIHAEALAFALAGQVPLPEAQAIVKEAARAEGGTLAERVAALCRARGLEPPAEGTDLGSAAAFIARVRDGI